MDVTMPWGTAKDPARRIVRCWMQCSAGFAEGRVCLGFRARTDGDEQRGHRDADCVKGKGRAPSC